MTDPMTLFFIVEPPHYQYMACHLAASAREHMPAGTVLLGYCPEQRLADLDPAVLEVMRRLDCEVRSFRTDGRFIPAYPHGNKILAALERRDTRYSAFMDSDMLFISDNGPDKLISPEQIGVVPSTSMRWAPEGFWKEVYDVFDLPVPGERISFTRDKREPAVPYFNSGLVVLDEDYRTPYGQTFAEVWMETAQTLDRTERIENKRPYLDQMTLPVAIQRAGITWNILPEAHNFSMGGIMRGKPLPEGQPISILHYRRWRILQESGWREYARKMLHRHAGTRRVSWVFLGTDDAAVSRKDCQVLPAKQVAAKPVPAEHPTAVAKPDPSKARMAAVTMVHEDYFFLDLWVRYWSDQIGREHLYVLSHGKDARIRQIAKGANVLHVPNAQDRSGFDRRRWTALSNYTSGLTLYYNWVICNDVDEIVAVDPAISHSVPDYLDSKFTAGAPTTIAPFALEIVHTPATETSFISSDAPILSARRNFRINSNYAKPCITRGRIAFSIGGHGCAKKSVTLDENLYLFHLRYVDAGLSRARLEKRRSWMEAKNGPVAEGKRRTNTWEAGTQSFDRLSAQTPIAETVDFSEARQRMIEGRSRADTGNWFFGKARSADLFRLPERFSRLF